MTRDPASLVLEKIEISLDGEILIRIDTEIGPGEILTVAGRSGAGKSTLLAFIAGFLAPPFQPSGRVILGGEDVTGMPSEKRRIGLLFQDAMLFPHMSVGKNLLFAIPAATRGRSERRALAEAALDEAGMTGFFDRDPATLSGGQKARAALMRVLLSEPLALLLDEPFSRLDASRRHQIREFVFDEIHRRRLPALLVTHDASDAEHAGGPVFDLG